MAKTLAGRGTIVHETSSTRTAAGRGEIVKESAAAAAGTNRLLLINPPGLDGGFGTGLSL